MLSRTIPSAPLRRLHAFPSSTRRPFVSSRIRHSDPTPNPPNQPSSFKEGLSRYKVFGGPFAKVFLGAIFTYQVLYWCWLKLEMDEEKCEKNKEVAALESKAKELTGTQK
ncbi:hypothetical protein PHISP_06657 [Aspergillus sp. HF37]|nr:hypothetical protein PHISP_06657 [Aspergillus sp. HF37]